MTVYFVKLPHVTLLNKTFTEMFLETAESRNITWSDKFTNQLNIDRFTKFDYNFDFIFASQLAKFRNDTVIIKDWCELNCVGRFGFKYNNTWHFKKKCDMIAFTMRWS